MIRTWINSLAARECQEKLTESSVTNGRSLSAGEGSTQPLTSHKASVLSDTLINVLLIVFANSRACLLGNFLFVVLPAPLPFPERLRYFYTINIGDAPVSHRLDDR